MASQVDPGIARLLLQLENPDLTDDEITKIKTKVEFLEARQKT